MDEDAINAATAPLPDEVLNEPSEPDAESPEATEPTEPEAPDEPAEPADGAEDAKPKRRRRNAEMEAMALRLESMERMLQAAIGGDAPAPPGDAPDPGDTERYPLGEIDGRYVADLALHTQKQDRYSHAIRQQEEAQNLFAREMELKWQVQRGEGEKKYGDDFARAVDDFDALRPSTELVSAIKINADGADVAMYLAAHPDEVLKLSRAHPAIVHQEVARIGARLTAAQTQRKISSAPKPPSPVGGREQVQKTWENMSMDDIRARFGRKKKRA